MKDADLIASFLSGEPRSVAVLQQWIRGGLLNYRDSLGDELSDLEQETILDLISALRAGRFEGRCGLRTYVSTFAHHKCIDRLRSRKRRTMVAIDQIELTSLAPSALDQLTRVEAAEVALRVQESMPDSCRELWSLLEEGLQYREMSRRLGVSEGALRARMLRCRRKALEFRQRLAKKPRNKDVVGSTK